MLKYLFIYKKKEMINKRRLLTGFTVLSLLFSLPPLHAQTRDQCISDAKSAVPLSTEIDTVGAHLQGFVKFKKDLLGKVKADLALSSEDVQGIYIQDIDYSTAIDTINIKVLKSNGALFNCAKVHQENEFNELAELNSERVQTLLSMVVESFALSRELANASDSRNLKVDTKNR